MKRTFIYFAIIYCLIYMIIVSLNLISFRLIPFMIPLCFGFIDIFMGPNFAPSTIIKKNKTFLYLSNCFIILGIFSMILYLFNVLDQQGIILILIAIAALFKSKYNYPEKPSIFIHMILILAVIIGVIMLF